MGQNTAVGIGLNCSLGFFLFLNSGKEAKGFWIQTVMPASFDSVLTCGNNGIDTYFK